MISCGGKPGLALAARSPCDAYNLFALDYKPFAPRLRAGQRLQFSLRANAVVASAPGGQGRRGKRHDVVMHALNAMPREQRAAERETLTHRAGVGWLVRQVALHGFDIEPHRLTVDGHDQVRIARDGLKEKPITFSVL